MEGVRRVLDVSEVSGYFGCRGCVGLTESKYKQKCLLQFDFIFKETQSTGDKSSAEPVG